MYTCDNTYVYRIQNIVYPTTNVIHIYMYQLANLESRFQAPPAGPAATAAVTHCAILQAEHT